MTATPQARTNPYVGPRAFQQGEKLYGRDHEVTQLLHLLLAERIVLFYSPSGAGKTSLIQAALIPRLEEEGLHVLPPMRVSLGPSADEHLDGSSNRYVFSLLLSLEEALSPEQRMPLSELSTLTLAEYLDRQQDGDEAVGTVLIFDQFEEILTVDPFERDLKLEFFAQVGAVLRDRRRWALFAMREEFIAGLEDPYLRPIPTRLRTGYRLELLAPQHAGQAIQEPAKAAGVTFAGAAADKLVSNLSTVRVLQADGSMEKRPGPYVEPVQLQVVCRRLWDLLPDGASQITEEDIERLADVDLALSGYYDDQVKAALSGYYAAQVQAAEGLPSRFGIYVKALAAALGFGVTERAIRNWFDGKLITEQGIRNQVLEGPEESEGLDNRAIRPLVDAHLVRAERRRGAVWLELAHDRLIEPVQASNAAWRRARLTRRFAVGIALIGIVACVAVVVACALQATAIAAQKELEYYEDSSAMISAPANGASFDEGETITFTGKARKGNGSDLTADLSWVSSLDGAIGRGGTFPRSDLSAGSHTVTASAPVSGGLTIVYSITITVNAVNDAPVANDDSVRTDEDTPLSVSAPGVLDNDTDAEGDPLTAILVSRVSKGSLRLNSDGSFSYTPDANYYGPDSFTYKANDGTVDSDPGTVAITVKPVNDPPVAVNDSRTTNEDTAVPIHVADKDSDVDGNLDAASANSSCAHGSIGCRGAAHGTLTDNRNGTITYTPNPDWDGSDGFVYEICDSGTPPRCDTAAVAITVVAINDPPAADDVTASGDEDVIIAWAPSVSDDDGDTLTCSIFGQPSNGSASVNSDCSSGSYTPDPNFNGEDTFTYKANDGTEDSNPGTVAITVNPVDGPSVNDVTVFYEDLPMDEDNDWDYNDLVIDITWVLEVSAQDDLLTATFTITQEPRAGPTAGMAAYQHEFHLQPYGDAFPCDGWYTLRTTRTMSTTTETGVYTRGRDFTLIPDTRDPPESVELSIRFDVPKGGGCPFEVSDRDPASSYHGQWLFFDPWLKAKNTDESIGVKMAPDRECRILTGPVEWKGSVPDGSRIWEVYPKVKRPEGPNSCPIFSPGWWE